MFSLSLRPACQSLGGRQELGKRGRFSKVSHRPAFLSSTVCQKGDPLNPRFINKVVLFGLIFIAMGCVSPGRDGNTTSDESKIPLSEKKTKEMENTLPESDGAHKYVPGQVLVKLKPGVEATVLDTIAGELDLETVQPLSLPGIYLMKIIGDESVESIINKLGTYDTVEYGEPNYIIQPERKSE